MCQVISFFVILLVFKQSLTWISADIRWYFLEVSLKTFDWGHDPSLFRISHRSRYCAPLRCYQQESSQARVVMIRRMMRMRMMLKDDGTHWNAHDVPALLCCSSTCLCKGWIKIITLKLQITCETANLFPLVGCYCRLFTDCTLEMAVRASSVAWWRHGKSVETTLNR